MPFHLNGKKPLKKLKILLNIGKFYWRRVRSFSRRNVNLWKKEKKYDFTFEIELIISVFFINFSLHLKIQFDSYLN